MASISENTVLEFRVGLFVVISVAAIAVMVLVFGRVGTGMRRTYPLTVELPNASGLLKDSKVLLSGATVGIVTTAPLVLDHARGVSVDLKIFEPTQIPRNAKVVVGSSGLLGDRFVDVVTTSNDEGGYFRPGETVHGTYTAGMEEVTRDAGALVTDLRGAVANLNSTITRVNQDLLKPEMFGNLQQSAANLSATTKNFQIASEKLGGVLDQARSTMDGVHGAVDGARGAIDGVKDTLGAAKTDAEELRKAIDDARRMLGAVRAAAEEAVHGNGLIGTLLSNHELAENLSALVANLRRNGVLFYKDRPPPSASPNAPEGDGEVHPSPRPRR